MSAPSLRLLVLSAEPATLEEVLADRAGDCDLVKAASPDEALTLGRERPFDVALLDDRVLDGATSRGAADLISRLRASSPDLLVVLLAGRLDGPELALAINESLLFRVLVRPCAAAAARTALDAACQAARAEADHRLDVATLRRRAETLAALGEVWTDADELSSSSNIAETVVRAVERTLPFDIGAALIAVGEPLEAALRIHAATPPAAAELAQARERILSLYNTLAGGQLAAGKLIVSLAGEPASDTPLRRPKTVVTHVPIVLDGRVIGVLYLVAYRARPFSLEEERLLYLVAAQTASIARRLGARVTAERRRMARIVDSMAEGVIVTDEHSEVALINSAARRLLSVPDDVVVTTAYLKGTLGFYPFDLVRGAGPRGDALVREEVQIAGRHLHSMVTAIKDGAGRPGGVLVVLRDLTEEKRLAQRHEEVISTLSHELRTPLTSIAGALDLVLDTYGGDLTDKLRRYAEMARSSCTRLNQVLDDLLDTTRTADRVAVRLLPLDLERLARDCIERYRAAAAEKHVLLGYRAIGAGEAPRPTGRNDTRILGDPERLGQVLGNLLSNAIKFAPDGGHVDVELFRPSSAVSHVGLSVWNDGAPIADDVRERIFDPFDEAAGSHGRRVGGTGLGLAVSRDIVEGHGGRIWVEPGSHGAKFVFTLPVAPEIDDAEVAPRDAGEARPAEPGAERSVLVVDDDRPTAYVLKGMLLAAGYRVTVAHDSDEALAAARAQRPDLVTLDLRMPGVDGVALLQILKHDPETRRIPVAVVSVSADRDGAIQAGADAYLGKPIDRQKLVATLERLLSERGRAGRSRVLVVDDEPTIRAICVDVLESAGYTVREASDGEGAIAEVQRWRPELVLLDLMMPGLDGYETARRIRALPCATMTPLIFVSARGQTADKVRAFKLGADDYLVKPFDATELVARVEKALERTERELGASPTTQLPGSAQIEQEMEARLGRLAAGEAEGFAFCYLDLDNLKAFNDYYGYAKADGMIRQTGDLVRDVVAREGNPGDFIGHIAGDDFVFITTIARVDQVCRSICDRFDRLAPLYYNKVDRERGYIETADRYGQQRRFPVMSVSIAALTQRGGTHGSYADLAARAAAAKQLAKALPGSSYVRDSVVVVPAPAEGAAARTATAGSP